MQVAILGLSLNLLGIAFAPIITPHLSERFGRQAVYLVSLPTFSLFILGASFSRSFAALAVCRFFAGFFGGPCLVLIEGTFADVWSAKITVAYYSFLALASFIGAACGKFHPMIFNKLAGSYLSQDLSLEALLSHMVAGAGLSGSFSYLVLAFTCLALRNRILIHAKSKDAEPNAPVCP